MPTWPLRLTAEGLLLLAIVFPSAALADVEFGMTSGAPHLLSEGEPVALTSAQVTFSFVASPVVSPMHGERCDETEDSSASCAMGFGCQADGLCHGTSAWQAELIYMLESAGAAEASVGLPFALQTPQARDSFGTRSSEDISDLSITVDGVEVTPEVLNFPAGSSVTEAGGLGVVEGALVNRVYTVPLHFDGAERRTLTVRYLTLETERHDQHHLFQYFTRTAGGFSSAVGSFEVAVQLPPELSPCVEWGRTEDGSLSSLPYSLDAGWVRLTMDTPGAEDFTVVWASREEVLQGTFAPFSLAGSWDNDNAYCLGVLDTVPLSEHGVASDAVELFFGAPHDGTRIQAIEEGPGRFCGALRSETGVFRENPNLQYRPDDAYPGNVPAVIAHCVDLIRSSR